MRDDTEEVSMEKPIFRVVWLLGLKTREEWQIQGFGVKIQGLGVMIQWYEVKIQGFEVQIHVFGTICNDANNMPIWNIGSVKNIKKKVQFYLGKPQK